MEASYDAQRIYNETEKHHGKFAPCNYLRNMAGDPRFATGSIGAFCLVMYDAKR